MRVAICDLYQKWDQDALMQQNAPCIKLRQCAKTHDVISNHAIL